jgi:iron complex outermembrane recepter protein
MSHCPQHVAALAAAVSLLTFIPQARAQTSEGKTSASVPELEEIVVTAEKRKESLQEVPISVQVIGHERLAEQNQNSLDELAQVVPGVFVIPSGGSNNMIVRGIGSGVNESFDQAVAMFIDDIYHGRSRESQAAILDIDHIEVLKGPQSTFFGNNAIAGALNVITQKPGDTFDASARALYGQFGQYVFESAVGGPLSDSLAARVAVMRNGESGWLDDVYLDRTLPRVNDQSGRVTLLFTPVANLDATLKIEGGSNRETGIGWGGSPFQIINCPPPSPFTPANIGPFGSCAQALASGVPIGVRNNENADAAGPGDNLSTFEDVLTINYRQWGQTFSSITGFYNYHFDLFADPFAQPVAVDLFTVQAPEKYHQVSQEFRVASSTGQAIEYLAGAYLQSDRLNAGVDDALPVLSPVIEATPPFAPLIPYLPLGEGTVYTQGEHSDSVFGSLSWKATEQLKLSLGLRGSWVSKDYIKTFFYGSAPTPFGTVEPTIPAGLQNLAAAIIKTVPGTLSGNRSDKAWMPSARIQYKIASQAMAYASYSRGFLAGGFNFNDPTGVAANVPYKPEYVNAYEAGLKTEWLDNRLIVNFDVFRSDYTDLQAAITEPLVAGGPVVQLVRNAASSRSEGFEFEQKLLISDTFRLSSNITYLHAYYISYPNAGATTLQQLEGTNFQNLSGQSTPFAPRWSGSVSAAYLAPVWNDYKFITEVSPFFSSRYDLGGVDDPLFGEFQSGYIRLDSRLSMERADGRWAVDLIGKNLTDRIVLTYGTAYITTKQPPRNVAIQLRVKF